MFFLPLLQITFTETPAAAAPAVTFFQPQDLLSSPWFWLVVGILGVVMAGWMILMAVRSMLIHSKSAENAFKTTLLMIRVPKVLRADDAKDEKSQSQIQELIGAMETVFSTVGALKAQKGFKHWLYGRDDTFAFEIVSNKGKINFYVNVPVKMVDFIEQQIHAQYPNAQIDIVTDYNIFSPTGVILGSYLGFRREAYFPIKTYRKLESDSMNALTNSLSKIGDEDGACIQYVLRSAEKSWRSPGLSIARGLQNGKKLKDLQNKGLFAGIWKELKSATATKDDKPKEQNNLSALDQEMAKGLEEKASKAGVDVNVRIMVSAQTPDKAQQYLNDILNTYGQFNIYEYGNGFKHQMPSKQTTVIRDFIYRVFDERYKMTMNAEEMATLYHFPLPSTETPKINWLLSRKALPPSNIPETGILLGKSEYRGHFYDIRMKPADRRRHMYVIGKSGSGKSVYQASLIKQDIEAGHGVCVIDPHGDLCDEVLEYVPKHRAEDVIFFDPADYERPMGLNMLEFDPSQPQQKTFAINEMLKIFDKLYDLKSTGGPMFELYMRNAILLLMDDPESGSTLMEIPKVLADENYRNYKLAKCKSQDVKDFWQKEALKAGGEASLANMVPYITSKLTPFIYNDYMRPIIGQQKSAFNLREVMDGQKILLLKLSKGKIGDLNAYLIGMVLVGKILMAALARNDMDAKDRKDFYLYIDEFQNFLTDSISAILSEARKYGLNLIIAHQFIGQLEGKGGDTAIKDAIFGNVGTMIAFRIGVEDAEFLGKEFSPTFSEYDLVNVEAFTCNAKILIDNTASTPFNFKPIMPPRPKTKELAGMMKELSRYKYGRKRSIIEAEIAQRKELSMLGADNDFI